MGLFSNQKTEARYSLLDPVAGGLAAATPPSRAAARPTTPTMAAALTATLGLAATCWVFSVREMQGMDMGVATRLGSFAFFVVVWISMMAAMMLPGAAPAVLRHAQAIGRISAVPLFVGSYLVVWALVGVVVFAVYRPHGTTAAGAVAVAAGVYELTPIKQRSRRRCHELRSGFGFGVYCVGSSIGLMLTMVAFGVMSVTWMTVIAVIGLAQKLVPPKLAIDVPLALAIVWLGALILVVPSAVPGLTPPM